MKQIILKPKREQAVLRRHPWVFSGGVAGKSDAAEEGERVAVLDHGGRRLATGHFQEGSIRVRIFHFGADEPAEDFWDQKLGAALRLRRRLGFGLSKETTCYRLVHGEGDDLPGLIVDIYGDTAVVQCHTQGMYTELPAITAALFGLAELKTAHVYDRSSRSLPDRFTALAEDGFLDRTGELLDDQSSQEELPTVRENGLPFLVDLIEGQKTGFFLDQRDNRALLGQYAAGAERVLNTFCYTGGFSTYALAAGAKKVVSVDLSERAIELTDRNVALLPDGAAARHESVVADVGKYLREQEAEQYDIVIVDPPAFAKSRKRSHNAVQAYKRLNASAMRLVRPGGLLFTFSCSQVVGRELFENTIVAAGLEAERPGRVLHRLGQGPDHPVNLYHPEGSYLKGLVVLVG